MSDLIISSNRTSQLLSSILDTEVQDLSYEMRPSYPLMSKQYVELSNENSPAGSMNGQETTFKVNRSQLLRNMVIKTSFTTTTTTLSNTQFCGLSMFEWIQIKSNNKVLVTLTDAALRARVQNMPEAEKLIIQRGALPLVATTEVVQATSTSATVTYTPVFSPFFEDTINNLDLSFYEQLQVTVKFNTPAKAGFAATTTTISDCTLWVWTYLPDQKYLDVLRSRNQQPSKPLSMLAWNSFTERKTCTSTTQNTIRLNVNYPVFKTFIAVHPIVATLNSPMRIDSFQVDVGGITLLNAVPYHIGQYEACSTGASNLMVTSATAVGYNDLKAICIDWSLLPQDSWKQCGGAVSFGNLNYPEITVNHQTLGTASNYELQVCHYYYNILTMSSSDGSIIISVRN